MLVVSSVERFLAVSEKVEKIICFGAGKQTKVLEKIFQGKNIFNKICFFVDNDNKKQSLEICIDDRMIPILSFEALKNENMENAIILITCVRYPQILEQLDQELRLKEVKCYCLSHLAAFLMEDEAMKKQLPLSLKRSRKELIPKTIHYCWFGRNTLPEKYQRWIDSWHRFCPEYEFIEWNEDNYDVSKNKYMKQAYDLEKWGFVPDVARLDIIYQHGGIYLDTDVELIKNMDDLLYQQGFVCFETMEQVNLGLGFGAVKGMPVIKKMLDLYDKIEFIKSDGSMNLTASPVWQTKVLKQMGLIQNGEYQIVEGMTIFPEKMLSGKSGCTRRIRLAPYTKAIHHYDGTWLNKDKKELAERFEMDIARVNENEEDQNAKR